MNLWNERVWKPMLLGERFDAFDSGEYLYEIKFDGIRAVIFATPQKIIIYNRHTKDITYLYPELDKIKDLVKGKMIFDGEIVMMENGKPSFSKLQKRAHLKGKNKIYLQSKENPVVFVGFDLLYWNKNLINLPLTKRKEKLNLCDENDVFMKVKSYDTYGKNLFLQVAKFGLEGIVAKKKESRYLINERSENWLKIKNTQEDFFYIGGYQKKQSDYIVSILLGEYHQDNFIYVGKAILGKQSKLFNRLKELKKKKNSPFTNFDDSSIFYVTPYIKCKVKYLEKTTNNQLRHPVIEKDQYWVEKK